MTHDTVWESDESRALAELATAFAEKRMIPNQVEWEETGNVPISLHREAAEAGLLGLGIAEEVGGSGGNLLDSLIFHEHVLRAGAASGVLVALTPHSIALPSIIEYGTPEQIDRYVRPVMAGEKVCALAITEPSGGSDVSEMRTRAIPDGDYFIISGAKTYISSGTRADFVTVAARTKSDGRDGVSLFVVEADSVGFERGRRLKKLGWLSSDTAELNFDNVRVPKENLIGAPGRGFHQLMGQLQSERLILATHGHAMARRALDLTVQWTHDRRTFGAPLASRQVVRHRIAEMARRVDVAQIYTRAIAQRLVLGEEMSTQVSMAKNTAVEAGEWVVTQALQLFGGLGYMRESEVERLYRDVRLYGIGGGTTEIMNEIIAKQILGDD